MRNANRRAARIALALLAVAGSGALVSAAPRRKKPPKKAPVTDDAGSAAGSAAPDPTPETRPDDAPAPAPTPTPTPGAGSATAETTQTEPDVDALRQQYLSLRDELFKSRARASTVASQLYSTRVTIKLTYTTARFYGVSKSSIRLDGANVYDNAAGGIAVDDGVRFEGYIAPGRHTITFHVEATGKDDDTFTTSTENQIVVQAVAGKDLLVAAKAKDSGDIAYAWKKGEHGSYGLGLDVAVKTTPREGIADGGKKK